MSKTSFHNLRQITSLIQRDCQVKNVYLQQVYLVESKKNNRYLLKLSNKKFIYIHIGVTVEYLSITPEVTLRKGDAVDGFGKCIKKYCKKSSISSILSCTNDDKCLTINFWHDKIALKIDCYGIGQALVKEVGSNNILGSWVKHSEKYSEKHSEKPSEKYSEKPSEKPSDNEIKVQLSLEEIVRNRNELGKNSKSNVSSILIVNQPKIKRRKRTKPRDPKLQIKSQSEKHLQLFEKKVKLANSIIESVDYSEAGDWAEINKLFKEAKSSREKSRSALRMHDNYDIKTKHFLGPNIMKKNLMLSPHRYKQFRYGISPNNILVLGTRTASQVNELVKYHLTPNHLYFHANIHGAPSVIIDKTKARPCDLEFAADCAVLWTNSKYASKVEQVDSTQVSLSAPSGQYLPKGSVIMTGKRIIYSTRLPDSYIYLRSCSDDRMEVLIGPYSRHQIGDNEIIVKCRTRKKGIRSFRKLLTERYSEKSVKEQCKLIAIF